MVTNIYDLKGKLVIKKSLSGNVKQSVRMKGRLTNGIGTGGAKAEFGTTEFWNEQIEYVPLEGTFIVYTDHIVIGDVPYLGVKIGDGVSLLSELKFISEGELHQLSGVAFSGSYDDLADVPTKLSQFSDDVGYLTEETDPTVPSWAKQPNKPTYTAEETGALPSDTPLFDGDYNKLSNKPQIPTVPTNVSAFINDVGYLKEHQSLTAYRTASEQDIIDAKKTEKIRIDIDVSNKRFLMGDTVLNFGQLNELLQISPHFLVFVMGKREHRCTLIDMDSNPRQMRFVAPLLNDGYLKTQSVYVTSNDGVNITNMTSSDINCENVSSKVTAITDANKNSTSAYPSLKAITTYVDTVINNLDSNNVRY